MTDPSLTPAEIAELRANALPGAVLIRCGCGGSTTATLIRSDVLIRLLDAAERAEGLEEALTGVMEWISAWGPDFTDDPEWPGTRDKVRAALARLGSPAGEEG